MNDKLLFIDTETGGVDPNKHSLLSLALVVWEDMHIIDTCELLINDGVLNATEEALSINKIDLNRHKEVAFTAKDAISSIFQFLKRHFKENEKITLAGHNINFDVNFLRFFLSNNNENFGKYFSHRFIDTSSILYYLYMAGHLKRKAISSSDAFALFGIGVKGRHTALGDAIATAKLYTNLLQLTKKKIKLPKDFDGRQLGLTFKTE